MRRMLLVAVVALTAAGMTATQAQGDPPGLVHRSASSAVHSFDKSMTAWCPEGTVVTGGGGFLNAPAGAHQGRVALDRLEPFNSGAGFVATMREVVDHDGDWQLTADAMCATAPSGYDVVSSTGPLNTQSWSVSCEEKKVIGVGGRVNNGSGDVILDWVVPSADLRTVSVRATRVAGRMTTGWSVTAFAVCANVTGLVLETPNSGSSSTGHKALSGSCGVGKGLYSAGAMISPGSGELFLTGVRTASVDIFSMVADEDVSGYNLNWVLFGYGICG